MKTNRKQVLGTALAAALMAGGAMAQEATLFPDEPGYAQLHRDVAGERAAEGGTLPRVLVTGRRSELSRGAVLAEVAKARADGSYDRGGEASFAPATAGRSTLTRAEVMAEVARARADGSFDTSGEHWAGADSTATRSAAAAAQLMAARR